MDQHLYCPNVIAYTLDFFYMREQTSIVFKLLGFLIIYEL